MWRQSAYLGPWVGPLAGRHHLLKKEARHFDDSNGTGPLLLPSPLLFSLFICAIYTAPDFVGLLRALTTLIATTKANDSDLYSSSAAGRRYLMHRIFGGEAGSAAAIYSSADDVIVPQNIYIRREEMFRAFWGVLNYVSRHFSKNLINLNSSI